MQVEFISNNVDVMTHDFLSSAKVVDELSCDVINLSKFFRSNSARSRVSN